MKWSCGLGGFLSPLCSSYLETQGVLVWFCALALSLAWDKPGKVLEEERIHPRRLP